MCHMCTIHTNYVMSLYIYILYTIKLVLFPLPLFHPHPPPTPCPSPVQEWSAARAAKNRLREVVRYVRRTEEEAPVRQGSEGAPVARVVSLGSQTTQSERSLGG